MIYCTSFKKNDDFYFKIKSSKLNMDNVRYSVSGECFELERNKIPKNSLLEIVNVTSAAKIDKDENGIILDLSIEEFKPIYDYLKFGIVPDVDDLPNFDYFNIDLNHSYDLALVIEEDMRANMYKNNDKKYREPYYGLTLIDENLWSRFKIGEYDSHDLLFKSNPMKKSDWNQIITGLNNLRYLTSMKGVFIAGGAIFSILFDLPIKDIDVFLYGLSETEAIDTIRRISDYFKLFGDDDKSIGNCTRTANAITFNNIRTKYIEAEAGTEIQIILRLYQTPSEVIHGFDVDCCCLGYDGNNVWMTQRAYYAFTNGYNTVNFNRLSPSYELRLSKYGTRGMSVKIPNFNRNQVKLEFLENYFKQNKPDDRPFYQSYKHIKSLKGLDILLYMEHHCYFYKYKGSTLKSIEKLNKESSDYSPIPFVHYQKFSNGNGIKCLLEYLENSKDSYPDISQKYMPFVKKILDWVELYQHTSRLINDICPNHYRDFHPTIYEKQPSTNKDCILHTLNTALELQTNSLYKNSKTHFIKGLIEHLDVILDIPDLLYKGLENLRPWCFSQQIKFKITNPGEQMTNTFNQIVLDDNKTWYNGEFYNFNNI